MTAALQSTTSYKAASKPIAPRTTSRTVPLFEAAPVNSAIGAVVVPVALTVTLDEFVVVSIIDEVTFAVVSAAVVVTASIVVSAPAVVVPTSVVVASDPGSVKSCLTAHVAGSSPLTRQPLQHSPIYMNKTHITTTEPLNRRTKLPRIAVPPVGAAHRVARHAARAAALLGGEARAAARAVARTAREAVVRFAARAALGDAARAAGFVGGGTGGLAWEEGGVEGVG
ncbi:hypothetical protein C7974DRAFT_449073 [Boeremia exigua]|uniref:uncharacterized protein n=1 Tax=Boeremia exigua TaxID=749465 RepID=UPI001E8EB2AC|nr:uncharacterized protein C7974DRAFT_449073 [Boeremia exigua]KAH6639144.1 hypothetical protein C7974DRAFT_449073 [Boeremia exigua]